MQRPKQPRSTPGALWKNARSSDEWTDIVARALRFLGGTASLASLYGIIEHHPRTKKRKHWQAKVRQRLEASDDFVRVSRGEWSFAEGRSARQIAKLNAVRTELHTPRPRAKKRNA